MPILIAHTSLLYQIPLLLLAIATILLWTIRPIANTQTQKWLVLLLATATASTLLSNPTWSGFWGMSWLYLAGMSSLITEKSSQKHHNHGLLLLTVFIVGEGIVRLLLGKLMGVDRLWLSPAKYAWRLSLLSGDWGGWTGILSVAAPIALARLQGKWRCVIALALTIILFFSGSRGAWLAAFASALAALAIARGRGWHLLLVNMTLFGLLFVFAGDLLFADRGGIKGITQSTGRVTFVDLALEAIAQRPLVGNGSGSFSLSGEGIYHPHNLVLAWLHDYGILGAAALSGWLWSFRGAISRERIPTLVAMGVYSLFMTPIMSVQVLWFWYMGGLHAPK